MKNFVKNIPIVGSIVQFIYRNIINPQKPFTSSGDYWNNRYSHGGNSGEGSYGESAEFKAEVLNNFVKRENIRSVIEFGSGDGNQLKLAEYPQYTGFDISKDAIIHCRKIFADDKSKSFKLLNEYKNDKAELALSLEVIFHLVEDEIFIEYMDRLFNSAEKFVIIFSSNIDKITNDAHVRHRNFSKWIETSKPGWILYEKIKNKYPYNEVTGEGGFSDFYIYKIIE